MEPSSKTPKEAYIEGRLMGLNELISILKDSMESGEKIDSSLMVKSVVQHISGEMESILDDVHGSHPPEKLAQIMEKHEQAKKEAEKVETVTSKKAPEALRKNVEAADELMKNLMALREQNT
ncbi:hypothetical protein HZC09_06355 [Candidatus Micrarchaeota archaeon]|nr:hypothetical protein [Candidatus Micrarchaeota archaeon]